MPRSSTENIRINVFIEPQVLKALKQLAKMRGSTYSEQVRTACRQYAVDELHKLKARHD